MPQQTFSVFWCNTEKSGAALSLLWSAEVLVILCYSIVPDKCTVYTCLKNVWWKLQWICLSKLLWFKKNQCKRFPSLAGQNGLKVKSHRQSSKVRKTNKNLYFILVIYVQHSETGSLHSAHPGASVQSVYVAYGPPQDPSQFSWSRALTGKLT